MYVDKHCPHSVGHFLCFDTSQCQFPNMSRGRWGLRLTSALLIISFPAVPHGVKRELWQKVYGNFVTDLTSSPKFINNSASITDILDKFDAEYDVGDDFGQRLTTYFMVCNVCIFFNLLYSDYSNSY